MRHTVSIVVRRSHLKERSQLSALLPRHRYRTYTGFNLVLVEIDKNEVIFWKLDPLITTFNTHNIGAWSFESLYQPRWKDWDEDTRPGQGIEELDQRLAC